jgi:hypothetical protein
MLSRLWKDKMDIYRYEETEVDGVTTNTDTLKYSDIKCHYSKGNLTDTGSDGIPTLVNSYSLFCAIETDLKEGDKIVVTQRNGRQVTLSVGEGFPYTHHQEFKVKRSGTA